MLQPNYLKHGLDTTHETTIATMQKHQHLLANKQNPVVVVANFRK